MKKETRTKKQIYDELVAFMHKNYQGEVKYDADDATITTFKVVDASEWHKKLKKAVELDKQNQNGIHANLGTLMQSYNEERITKWMTLKYNKVKDSISISVLNFYYNVADKKQIIYPVRERDYILCYGKRLYNFLNSVKTKTRKRGLRVFIPSSKMCNMPLGYIFKTQTDEFFKILFGGNMIGSFNEVIDQVPLDHLIGYKDLWEYYEEKHDLKIPKVLKQFNASEVITLAKALGNIGELNSLCQYLPFYNNFQTLEVYCKRNNSFKEFLYSYWITQGLGVMRNDSVLYRHGGALSSHELWDWISDNAYTGNTMSLKTTSTTRIMDEHRKLSRLRILAGVKAIKTHKDYKILTKDFPIENAELINDKERLAEESANQNHCVATYAQTINNGECCIMSFPYQGEQWTLQVALQGDKFQPVQLRGKNNKSAPKELEVLLREHFDKIPCKQVPHWA